MNIAKWLIITGFSLIIVGLITWGITKLGLPIGKLPGDIQMKTKKFGIYFPIATSIVLSIVLTIVLNLILWLFRK
ncbi:MAG: hypothetical protein KR126chlam1_00159 [Chlamydiae bacterium]|nr:hypothetical protein [Chlamydiota bacterium]